MSAGTPLWTSVAGVPERAEDIRIVDLLADKTTWSRVHEDLRVVYLALDREPDVVWVRYFHEERESRVMPRRHGLWIEGGCIAFDCVLADVESHHLPDIRRSVEYANRRYREYVEQYHRNAARRRVDDADERSLLAGMRDRLRDTVGTTGVAAPVRVPASAVAAEAPMGSFAPAVDDTAPVAPLPDTASLHDAAVAAAAAVPPVDGAVASTDAEAAAPAEDDELARRMAAFRARLRGAREGG